MSVLFASDDGFYISHEKFIEQCYKNVTIMDSTKDFAINKDLFNIIVPFNRGHTDAKIRKRKSRQSAGVSSLEVIEDKQNEANVFIGC